MSNKIVAGLIVVMVVVGAVFLLSNKTSQQNKTVDTQPAAATSPTSTDRQTSDVIVTSKGFEPQTITITRGNRVVWLNKSGNDVAVASNDHPTHLLYPPLNLGRFKDGSSVQLIFDKPGTYGYHNHYNPTQSGTVVVK